MFDYLVVGKGLFGAAAARRLSQFQGTVAILGPDEPADPEKHEGVFASHYDQGRIVSATGPDEIWTALDELALGQYRQIEAESGIRFHYPKGLIRACRPSGTHGRGKSYRYSDGGGAVEISPQEAFDRHGVRLPEDFDLLSEGAPSGYINPRDLIRAQLAISRKAGLQVIRETARRVVVRPDRVAVETFEGNRFEARKALLAAGAYTNSFELLERKLALRVKTETIVLARVPEEEADRLAEMPAVNYEYEDDVLNDIYLLPPIRYPDGEYYVKMGCNNVFDRNLETFEETQAWMKGGEGDRVLDAMRNAVLGILPGLVVKAWRTKRCLVTYTPHGRPYVDTLVPDRLYVATAGNGKGAHPSPGIGLLAADWMACGEWDFPHAQAQFRVRYA